MYLQSRLVGEACQGGNRRPSKGMLFSFHTFKRISTLFSRHFAISSRRTRSLGAFGAMSTSPSPARDLEVPMSAAQDLYLQLKRSLSFVRDAVCGRSLIGIYDLHSTNLLVSRRDLDVWLGKGQRAVCETRSELAIAGVDWRGPCD